MPFTFSHPAAAVPLLRPLGRYGVLSALVVGSMSPDFAYFVPVGAGRFESHSLSGMFTFCLPAALATYLAFHLLLKGPLLALLPRPVLERLGDHARAFRALPRAPWPAVVVSLLAGIATHLAWDAFTHVNTPVTRSVALFQAVPFSIGTFELPVYKILQHSSTAVGLLLLAYWCVRWMRATPPRPARLPFAWSPLQRVGLLGAIAAFTMAAALWTAIRETEGLDGLFGVRRFVGEAIFAGLPAFTLALGIYSVAWHLAARRARSG